MNGVFLVEKSILLQCSYVIYLPSVIFMLQYILYCEKAASIVLHLTQVVVDVNRFMTFDVYTASIKGASSLSSGVS